MTVLQVIGCIYAACVVVFFGAMALYGRRSPDLDAANAAAAAEEDLAEKMKAEAAEREYGPLK